MCFIYQIDFKLDVFRKDDFEKCFLEILQGLCLLVLFFFRRGSVIWKQSKIEIYQLNFWVFLLFQVLVGGNGVENVVFDQFVNLLVENVVVGENFDV